MFSKFFSKHLVEQLPSLYPLQIALAYCPEHNKGVIPKHYNGSLKNLKSHRL